MKINGVTIWHKKDLDGFFGLFTNIITNILVLAGLLVYTVKIPESLVYGRILPAVGLGIFLSCTFYFYSAYKLAKEEGRDDVTALPSGISVPHMFLIVYMIILPVNVKTQNPILAWQAGIAWCLVEGIIEFSGAFIGKWIRKVIPRAALLGSLAGVSITCIMANAALQSMEVAYIALAGLAIIILGFVAKKKMPFGLPTGLVAILFGTVLGWISGYMNADNLVNSFSTVGVYIPTFSAFELVDGFKQAAPFLLSAIPMGIYNFLESLDNLESASVAGDKYNTTQILMADGVTSIISALFGNPVPTAVYIGHPGWKSIGARIGYSWVTGVVVLIITIFGIESILLNIIPVEALLPILIYIGILIGTQAFEHVPSKHFPAIILGLLPWLADWGKTLINNAISAAGVSPTNVTIDDFVSNGIYFEGLEILSNGAILIGIIWTTLMVFMLERKQKETIILCIVAAGLSFFGIIHSNSIGIGQNLPVVVGYLLIVFIIILMYKNNYEN